MAKKPVNAIKGKQGFQRTGRQDAPTMPTVTPVAGMMTNPRPEPTVNAMARYSTKMSDIHPQPEPRRFDTKETLTMVRKELKTRFPDTKFSVTQGSRGGHLTVPRVSWVDGPTADEVKDTIGQYASGGFDSMQDMAIRHGAKDVTIDGETVNAKFSVDWYNYNRTISPEVKAAYNQRAEQLIGRITQDDPSFILGMNDQTHSVIHTYTSDMGQAKHIVAQKLLADGYDINKPL